MRKEWRDLLSDVRVIERGKVKGEVRLIVSRTDINLRLGIWKLGLPKEYEWPQQRISMQMLVKGKWKKTQIIEVQGIAEECVRRCEKERRTIVAVRFDDDDEITLLVDEAHLYD